MKVLLDTNVLVSTALFPNGVVATAFELAVSGRFDIIIPQYALDELKDVCLRKFPSKIREIQTFVDALPETVKVHTTSTIDTGDEASIRDPKDWPIWQTAKAVHADILVTGDKDFLDSGLSRPQIMNAHQFLAAYSPEFDQA